MADTYHTRGELVDGYPVREHPLYQTWASMKARCRGTAGEISRKNYSSRGISYCDQWAHFANFAADMGAKPYPEATLERVDNAQGYGPSNCVWASRTAQSHNRRKFQSNTTGFTGVVKVRSGFNARFDDGRTRFNLGNFASPQDAAHHRTKFIMLYRAGDPTAFAMLERRARQDSSTGIRGITAHQKGGYVVRITCHGKRQYLGFATTLFKAIEILNAYQGPRS